MNYNNKNNIAHALMADVNSPVYLQPIRRDLPY